MVLLASLPSHAFAGPIEYYYYQNGDLTKELAVIDLSVLPTTSIPPAGDILHLYLTALGSSLLGPAAATDFPALATNNPGTISSIVEGSGHGLTGGYAGQATLNGFLVTFVFNDPSGSSISSSRNSTTGNWLDTTPQTAPPSVPESSSLSLVLGGLAVAVLASCFRRRLKPTTAAA